MQKKKIAVLGGGVGAMAAAFALTDRPGWQDDYELTVYQMGWRLGGKGASGRNAALGQRIEEHGLHMWLGFYDNAFHLIQKCYQELGRPAGSPLATWEDAFKKHSLVTVMEHVNGQWVPWTTDVPTDDEVPGQGGASLTPWNYVCLILKWMVELFEEAMGKTHGPAAAAPHRASLFGWFKRIWHTAEVLGSAYLSHLHRAHKLAHSLDQDPSAHMARDHHALLGLLEDFLVSPLRATEEELTNDTFLRRTRIRLALGGAIARGIVADGVLFHGFDCIDQYDFTEWLRRHGATDPDIWWSAPVRGIYDLVFGFEGGDPARPNLAAGTALRGCLRMFFGYKGAVFWKMQAGMGEAVFTPFYEVLRRRGVRFEFFRRVDNLGLSADQKAIDTIALGVQATVKPEVLREHGSYQPLVEVRALPCWPSEPLYEQLVEGEELRRQRVNLESAWTPWPDVAKRTLRRGEDFDLVVLGISLGALPHLCRELLAASPRWRDMVTHVKTAATQAFQIWLSQSAAQLGWETHARTMASAYIEPMDTWADMSQLLDKEDWPADTAVQNVTYFCGPLTDAERVPPPFTDPGFPASQAARVQAVALEALRTGMKPVFPEGTTAPDSGALRWELLVDPAGGQGEERFNRQYWRANVEPSERYVLSPKGSTPYRLPADQSGFEDLYLAGDWVATGVNAGCVEAAAMAGLQAARAICGEPQTIIGEKDL